MKSEQHIKVFTIALFIILMLSSAFSQSNNNFRNDSSHKTQGRPAWLNSEPLIIVGNWDTAPIFRIRKGGNPEWHQQDYDREHSEEAVVKLKELGVTMAVIHFYKGFGLQAEKEQLQDAKKLAALCQKHGLRVGVYVGSTVGYETFLLEKPEAQEWFLPDYLGQPVIYSSQSFRKRVYFKHPGYIAYIKQVLKIAVEELKVDLIHFDNTSLQAQVPAFYHPLAIEHFRTFLRGKFTPDQLKQRFGFADVSYVEPPRFTRPLRIMNDPLFQEWTNFRCQQLTNYYADMADYIHNMNPNVVVENNPSSGLSGSNTMWHQGVDYPRLLAFTDIVWTEEGNEAAVTEKGILLSKIRTYKMASTLNNKIFTYTADSELQMAEAMAYNRQCLGMVGGILAGYELQEKRQTTSFDNPYTWGGYLNGFEMTRRKADYIRFYHDNFDYYRDIDNIADVAVLHSYASMTYNNHHPYVSTYLFEQVLIQDKVPFDIIFDNQLKDLSKYTVLVLADQECLSDKQCDLITDFVKNGGGLVVTGHTSLYTEQRRRRSHFGLDKLLEVNPPKWPARGRSLEQHTDSPIIKNSIAQGRVVYVPHIKPAIQKPATAAMSSQYWQLPLNMKELIDAIKWAKGNDLSLDIKAPQTVTMELAQKRDDRFLMLHLLNYEVTKMPIVKNIAVNLKIPTNKSVEQVKILSPDMEKEEIIMFNIKKDRVIFTVPQLKIYNLVVMALK